MREQDKPHLAGDTSDTMEGDSTEFESSEYEEFIQELGRDAAEKRVKLTDRERTLITGIAKQNASQKLKNFMFNFMKNQARR